MKLTIKKYLKKLTIQSIPNDCKEAILKFPVGTPVSALEQFLQLLPKHVKWYISFDNIEFIPLKEENKEIVLKYPNSITAIALVKILETLNCINNDKKWYPIPKEIDVEVE